ncbi:hypothetical protein AK812_SmicGene28981 [Symbiodinium microadriaticum]|uniref:Uncharacterized protein n=1 Tax=Symbiodinium microadriaticum TaxID=2951 RepID=A0A1Q9D307_SYMMI|nr:hypothetical protein AK812_SmicGene28981 [Symbiodinium microadriaticum]
MLPFPTSLDTPVVAPPEGADKQTMDPSTNRTICEKQGVSNILFAGRYCGRRQLYMRFFLDTPVTHTAFLISAQDRVASGKFLM